MEVYELDNSILEYLSRRNILSQYRKAKELLILRQFSAVHFKKRKPKSKGFFYFRINQKYRAIGVFDGKNFIVTEILDHQ